MMHEVKALRLRVLGAAALAAVLATPLVLGIAQAQQMSGAPGAASLPAGPGRDELVARCSSCHVLGTITGKRRSAEDWQDVVARMVGLGAQPSPAEAKLIQAYLIQNYGEQAAPAQQTAAAAPATAQAFPRPQGANQWPAYGGGGANTNFSDLTQINTRNVGKLKQAWVYRYGAGQSTQGDQGLDSRFEATPLIIGGVMYVSTPANPLKPGLKASIVALRPESGEVIWKFESPLNIHGRGLAYWPGDEKTPPRLIFGTDQGMIMAVDVTTGALAAGFGRRGQIDAYVGVVSEIVGESRRSTFTIPNPVTIYKDLIITGARPGEVGPPAPRGDVRAWDVRTGRLVWTFHTVPQPGDANADTYKPDEWRDISGANVWSTMSLDEANGIVFAPVGDLNSGAKGSQLYANSLLALDAATGKLKWHRQITHHDIWDWDLPTPPVLFDLKQGDKTVPVVLLTGKQSLMFMFNRLTGEPINGFDEKPTPQPATPSDEVWPTQPFPRAPGPLARTQMTRDEIPNVVPGMREACTAVWDENKIISPPLYGPRQSPTNGIVTYPGPTGGPNWGGGSFNPELNLYFINLQNRPSYRGPVAPGSGYSMMSRGGPPAEGPAAAGGPPAAPAAGAPRPQRPRGGGGFSFKFNDATYLPCGPTPWGELVAVDVAAQKIVWRAPLGMTEALGAAGANTGAPNLGGSIATKSGLVFIGATNDRRFRAFDAKTGKKLWEAKLEASAHATPITYMGKDGKQYVVVAAAGGTSVGGPETSDTIVAYVLP